DTLTLETFSSQTKIGGGLLVNGGDGNITVANNTAAITGSATFNLGGGNNNVSFDNGSTVGGAITYHNTGSGANHLTLAGAQTYNVNVNFGAGDDTFTLNNAAAVLNGLVNGDGHIVANLFQILAGTLGTVTVVNFP